MNFYHFIYVPACPTLDLLLFAMLRTRWPEFFYLTQPWLDSIDNLSPSLL